MIGRRNLPESYLAWNKLWGAPNGHESAFRLRMGQRLTAPNRRELGPFAFQPSSPTRSFEYPWAYLTAELEPGMQVLESGGGLAGLQYVLDMQGCTVTNADPLVIDADNEWARDGDHHLARLMTPEHHEMLNGVFGTRVRLLPRRLQECPLEVGSFDRIFCLSVLEHLDADEARSMTERMAELLAPGGMLLLTVDLFFDVAPLGRLPRNGWGTNHDVRALTDGLGLERVAGEPRELLGFDEFDIDYLVESFPELLIGDYPVASQAVALRKPAEKAHRAS